MTRSISIPTRIVSRDEWLSARKALLARERALTHELDALRAERRQLPWVKVDKAYVFEATDGEHSLADLFRGRSQLAVYHFMLAPDSEHQLRHGHQKQRGHARHEHLRHRRSGDVFHTYSTYHRGDELLIGAFMWLDLVPKGRSEDEGVMSWVRLHDEYPST